MHSAATVGKVMGPVRPPEFDEGTRQRVVFDELLHETGKAAKFRLGEVEMWFQLSCIDFLQEHHSGAHTVEVPTEMFQRKCEEQNVNTCGYEREVTPPQKSPQVQNIPKEQQTMKTSVLIALMTEGFTLVGVRFRRQNGEKSAKVYHYKHCGDDIAVGDMVIVESPTDGFVITDVVEVDHDPVLDIDAGFSYKWTVQKVDTTMYEQHRERELGLTKHLKRLRNKAEAERALTTIREELRGTDAGQEFENLVAQLNVKRAAMEPLPNNRQPTPQQFEVLGVRFELWPNNGDENTGSWNIRRLGDQAIHKGFRSRGHALDMAKYLVESGAIK